MPPARRGRQHRQLDGAQKLVDGERGFEDARDEARRGNAPFAARAERDRRGAQRRQHGDPVGGGIGMRQAAADRAAVAHRAVSDAARDGRHDLADSARHRSILDRRVRRAGADADRAARPRNTGIARQVAQVGDGVGLRQAKIEQRPQRLRAGAWPPAGSEKL